MDIETLIGALTGGERDELLAALTVAEKPSGETTDDAEGDSGCCGGGRRSMQKRHAMMAEMRQMCCGAS